jgi:hypothetical protein
MFVLKIEIMANQNRLRYSQLVSGNSMDMVSLPLDRNAQGMHITCTKHPGDTRNEVSKAQIAEILRGWRKEAVDIVVVDHRKAIEQVTLPSGIALTCSSNLLLLVKAYQQWQQGETLLAEDDAQALRIWIGNRVPFGMDAVDAIKDMKVLNGLEEV